MMLQERALNARIHPKEPALGETMFFAEGEGLRDRAI